MYGGFYKAAAAAFGGGRTAYAVGAGGAHLGVAVAGGIGGRGSPAGCRAGVRRGSAVRAGVCAGLPGGVCRCGRLGGCHGIAFAAAGHLGHCAGGQHPLRCGFTVCRQKSARGCRCRACRAGGDAAVLLVFARLGHPVRGCPAALHGAAGRPAGCGVCQAAAASAQGAVSGAGGRRLLCAAVCRGSLCAGAGAVCRRRVLLRGVRHLGADRRLVHCLLRRADRR